ncbi:uncharacterized protein LOC133920785 [Phragmites australis]|uniref:uncharacterized protein LOC133920785 n=1 Tax=Phragmites australis TaxID=29695 RepID=UPI002D77EF28|nr:uncharacterized protein LOC133920785 [Phragmites australis]
MALDNYSYDCCVFPPLDWEWELQTLGGTGDALAAAQEAIFPATPGVESPVSSEASSGYLQDAVAYWGDRCNKRQRMGATAPPSRRPAAVSEDLQCLLDSFWVSSAEQGDLSHDLNTKTNPEMSCSIVSEEDGAGASGREEQGQLRQEQDEQRGPSKAKAAQVSAAQGGEEAAAVVPPPRFSTTVRAAAPLRLQKATAGAPHAAARRGDRSPPVDRCEPSRAGAAATTAPGSSCPSSPLAGGWLTGEKRGAGVLYPFAVVKPLGLDDGRMTTLSDVNQRILKRPARPVRHPVGAFACGPAVSARGLGLSGKAVISLTRIRTGGKGAITIVRTRG